MQSISMNLRDKTVLQFQKLGYARMPGTKVFCGLHNCNADSLR